MRKVPCELEGEQGASEQVTRVPRCGTLRGSVCQGDQVLLPILALLDSLGTR